MKTIVSLLLLLLALTGKASAHEEEQAGRCNSASRPIVRLACIVVAAVGASAVDSAVGSAIDQLLAIDDDLVDSDRRIHTRLNGIEAELDRHAGWSHGALTAIGLRLDALDQELEAVSNQTEQIRQQLEKLIESQQ